MEEAISLGLCESRILSGTVLNSSNYLVILRSWAVRFEKIAFIVDVTSIKELIVFVTELATLKSILATVPETMAYLTTDQELDMV